MKRILFIPAILLLMMAGSSYSCGEKETEIEYSEYSLSGTDCDWTNLAYDNKVTVINSKSELEKYIVCTEGTYPEIDFSKYTLLLAHGGTTNGVDRIGIIFYQSATNKYTLKVTVQLNLAAVAEGWNLSILVPKVSNDAKITLEEQQN